MDRGTEGTLQYFRWVYADVSEAGPLEERWHEDVVLRQSPEMPGTAGTFTGVEGVRDTLRELGEGWTDLGWDPLEVREVGGDRYVLRVDVRGKGRGSGIELGDELGHLIELRDGKVFRLDVYMNWESALRAARVDESEGA